jgi:integrase
LKRILTEHSDGTSVCVRSVESIKFKLEVLKRRWSGKPLSAIRVGEIEDLIQDLRAKKRKPATINRHLALLRHMMNWAVGREHLEHTPFRRGSQALIKFEREDNRQIRRVTRAEEKRLLASGNQVVRMMIVAALDTGMRRGELLSLRFGDIDFDQAVINVRAENAKSKKSRPIPIGTTRLRSLLDWLKIGPDAKPKAPDVPVFTRGDDDAIKSFRTAWERARKAAGCETVRFHDLRSEYASRLVEHGVPLSQVRDLLGHCSIVVTERYDRQVLASLKNAVGKLDDGQTFNFLSTSDEPTDSVESTSTTH